MAMFKKGKAQVHFRQGIICSGPEEYPVIAALLLWTLGAGLTAAGGKQVAFLDLARHFLDGNGGLSKAIMPDGLHPSTKGFGIWAKAMERPLRELLGEGKK